MRSLANLFSRPRAYVSFQVRVPPELKEKLARKSFETGVSQAAIVVAALEHYLAAGLTPAEDAAPAETEEEAGREE
ncbi:hypothetical protein JCM39194_22160 [Desulfotomaculum varum]